MKIFKNYSDFLYEKKINQSTDLFKIYLGIKKSSNHIWWTYKEFASNNFFIQITEDNIYKFDVNPNLPILNYSSEIIKKLLKEKRIRDENIINHPNFIKISGSKKHFHDFIGQDDNLPKTVYTQKEAFNLNFPIIAKPSNGHSGLGIKIFYSPDELKKNNLEQFDIFSEYIDKKEEHRFFNYKGKQIFWMERKPLNKKAKNGKGEVDEKMMFQYIKKNVNYIPDDIKQVLKKFCDKLKDLPFICLDVLRDKNDKIYVIESNAQPGVPFDSTVVIYKEIFKDFYGRPVNEETEFILNQYSKELVEKTLLKDNKRFIDESS